MADLSSDAAIAALAAKVLDTTLPKSDWSHAGHFAFALWCLRHRPDLAEPAAMRLAIKALNAAQGTADTDTSGYHHTITIASLHAARVISARHAVGAPLAGVLADLQASRFGKSDWIFAHWSKEVLFSPEARRDWVAPDLAPL